MKISVVIPVFNAANFIERAVESALAQRQTGEVVLVEDGSDDGSFEICERLSEKDSVRLLTHEKRKNKGAGTSRNLGIREANFDFVAFLDADDYFLENRFSVTEKVFEKFTEADGVYEAIGTDFATEDLRKEFIESGKNPITSVSRPIEPVKLFQALALGGDGYFSCDGLTVRKSVFGKCGYFDEKLRLSQDTELWLRMATFCKLFPGEIYRPVANRTITGENRSSSISEKEGFSRAAEVYEIALEKFREFGADSDKIALLTYKRIWNEVNFEFYEASFRDTNKHLRSRLKKIAAHDPELSRKAPRIFYKSVFRFIMRKIFG